MCVYRGLRERLKPAMQTEVMNLQGTEVVAQI